MNFLQFQSYRRLFLRIICSLRGSVRYFTVINLDLFYLFMESVNLILTVYVTWPGLIFATAAITTLILTIFTVCFTKGPHFHLMIILNSLSTRSHGLSIQPSTWASTVYADWLSQDKDLVVKLYVYHLMIVFWSKSHPPNILEYNYTDQHLI